ncbi:MULTISPECIES: NupC/NupG family nucleoside CNT transporter [Staphylococcus]|uniref:NupC/NupG family nucleoside CNT transporter n=1 Tax=Staphylococcus chromogenes TaxID=46126 RepID=A0AAE5T2H8_STACR|nr:MULTISPECIES: NupC/NupG family nucleoside CNT transporter [Staphylococcus]KDP14057.1 pyrimidine nucleoside transport protein [Staphylococcus chromogenes MU 970]MBP0046742.1 NupC/NupG family nucleoside CNT transporter [Staphylococcus chromogenes]MBV5138793.1 NupC/NupG family nucleoside CNT transporter [Staphylococcus chromogenes]MBV5192045.1 NupC/NupG family nucleoside CNT transporter [Staphylococcus chromogenes]MBW3133473.1 NupC/NupG family nucleoside CNT transporter [Staphylococcus chromog
MHILIGIVGILVFLGLAWLASSDKKNVRWHYIGLLLLIQLIFAFILLKTNFGVIVVGGIANGFAYLLKQAAEGVNFVFGGLANKGEMPFFLNVLLPIVFISALIGILQYLKILPIIINVLGFLISKVNGMGRLESYNAVASAILGQSEVFISLKKQLPYIPKHRLYTLTASAMSTVSASIIGAYFTMVKPEYVVTAVVLNLFGGFIVASIVNPYKVNEKDDKLLIEEEKKQQSFFEMLGEYILDGFKVAVIVGAMLIGYIALITFLNGIVGGIIHFVSGGSLDWNFQTLIGFVFAPLAFLTGIPWHDAVEAGSIMATKLLSNEFVAMTELGKANGLSERALGVVSVFLVSFANFSSIGIISGAIKSLNDEKGDVVARFGLKLLFGATLVSFISATIAGFFL